jgi:signal transduction histidine kinase
VASVASLIGRFRRSTGDTRQQLKWVLFGVSFFIPVFMGLGFVIGGSDYEHLLRAPIMIAEAIFLTSYGIALAKYRLYDVDVVINRTLVLAVLAGFITLTYALVVVGVGQLVGGDEDGLALPIAATALVAVAFEPVRLRAQTWANRLVYGERATPYEVLSDLTARLAGAEEGQGILGRMATLILEGTGAERVTVWLGGTPGGIEPSATAGSDSSGLKEPELDADEVFPVHHDGEVVGVFEVVKPRGSSLSTAERSLIADLAGSAGAVLGYQRLNDSLAERARELDESRLRLLEAQDEERRRLERDLHDGAQQMLVGLKVKIGVAAQLAERHGADQLVALLRGLSAEAQAALDEVRLLARGIYPPVLESDGLGSAISALAASAPIEVSVSEDGLGRYPMEVEAAVYFDVSEAVTNAVKHARTPVRIDLLDDGERLRFTVSDTGPGFDTRSSTAGSGLVNMADRLDSVGGSLVIESGSEGTRVRGVVPLSVARSPQPESTQVSASRVGSNSDLERKATAPASRALDSYSPAS